MYKLWPTAPRLYCVDRSRWRSHILQPPLHRAVDDLQAVFVQLAYQQQHRLQDVGILKQVHSQALKFTGVGAWSNAGPGPKHFLRPVYTEIRIKMHLKTKQNCSFFYYSFFKIYFYYYRKVTVFPFLFQFMLFSRQEQYKQQHLQQRINEDLPWPLWRLLWWTCGLWLWTWAVASGLTVPGCDWKWNNDQHYDWLDSLR